MFRNIFLFIVALALCLVGVPKVNAQYNTINYPGSDGTYINGISGNTIFGNYGMGGKAYGFLYNGTTYTTINPPTGTMCSY